MDHRKKHNLIRTFTVAAALSVCCLICALLASCATPTVEFSFDAAGGSLAETTLTVTVGGEYSLPVPQRDGYEFDGWYLSADCSGAAESLRGTVTDENASRKFYAKWIRLYTVTFDADGGRLDKSSVVLKEGANISDAVAGEVPTLDGAKFDFWSLGNEKISDNRLIAQDITLKANYKWAYTVEYYLQNKALDGYERADDMSFTDYASAGAVINAETVVTGFKLAESADNRLTVTVKAKGRNDLKVYLDRNVFNVTFRASYPDGTESDVVKRVVYGDAIPVLTEEFSFEGYLLVGWSTTEGGETAYYVDTVGDKLVNEDGRSHADTFAPDRHTVLHAVWQKGYVNKLGGDDYLFTSRSDERAIYLCRGGVFFKGRLNASGDQFRFFSGDDEILYGAIYGDGTFIYGDGNRAETSAKLYVRGEGVDESVTLYFDEFDGVTLVTTTDAGREQSEGVYELISGNRYKATFTSGKYSGKTVYFMLGKVNVDGMSQTAFQMRVDAEYDMGVLYRFAVSGGNIVYYTDYYKLTLDGFGGATMYNGGQEIAYNYTFDAASDMIKISTAAGADVFTAKYYEGQVKGYFIYNEEFDHVYDAGGGTLTLDGGMSATYRPAVGEAAEGYYTMTTSAFGGNVVTLTSGNRRYRFLIETRTETSQTGDQTEGEPQSATYYVAEEKTPDYAEYYHKGETDVYYYPLIVTGDDGEGKARVYGRSGSEYVLCLIGSVTGSESVGYRFTAEQSFDVDVDTSIVDLTKVLSFDYRLASVTLGASEYAVNYWLGYRTADGETTYRKIYRSGDESLELVAGYALTGNGALPFGTYKRDGDVVIVEGGAITLAFEVDDSTMTFVALEEPPFTAYLKTADGRTDENVSLYFNGKGGVTYKDGDTTAQGVYSAAQTTYFGDSVYRFTSDGVSFTFVFANENKTLFFKNHPAYSGEYPIGENTLILDGYGVKAEYDDAEGFYVGGYTVDGAKISLTADGKTFTFDYHGTGFTVRGSEYAEYLLIDNGGATGIVGLDGYGGATVYALSDEGERTLVDDGGSYFVADDGTIFLSYGAGGDEKAFAMTSGTYRTISAEYRALYVIREQTVKVFVDAKTWGTLLINDIGGAIRYDTKGNKTVGRYTFVTSGMMFFEAEDGSDACVYDYDAAARSAVKRNFDARGYYTEDLHAILFTQYGLVVTSENGVTRRAFYNMDDNDVLIYTRSDDPSANEFGFVTENFGRFTDRKTWKGKEYFVNAGISIRFEAAGVPAYPIDTARGKAIVTALSFAPTGSDEFSVSGRLTMTNVEGAERTFTRIEDCTVQRVRVGDGYKIYVILPSDNLSFRYSVDVEYLGTDGGGESLSRFTVTGVTTFKSVTSYTYLAELYSVYLFSGAGEASRYKNNVGDIEIYADIDAEGNVGETLLKADLDREHLPLKDSAGADVSFDGVPVLATASGVYLASAMSTDGYKYNLRLVVMYHQPLRAYGFAIYAFSREQTLVSGDYTLTVETALYSQYNGIPAGATLNMTLADGENSVKIDSAVNSLGAWRLMSRLTDPSGRILSTVCYSVKFSTATSGVDLTSVAPYSKAEVTSSTITTAYTAGGDAYADIDLVRNEIYLLSVGDSVYAVTQCDHDTQTGVFTIKTNIGKIYHISYIGGVLTIENA